MTMKQTSHTHTYLEGDGGLHSWISKLKPEFKID